MTKETRYTILALILGLAVIGGAVLFGSKGRDVDEAGPFVRPGVVEFGTATREGDVQYVDITARGGYSPRVIKAAAGVPTVIRMKTENTYDCSIALVIPDLGYQSYLKPTDTVEIPVPVEKTQGTLKGMCSMAMYHFQIDFE